MTIQAEALKRSNEFIDKSSFTGIGQEVKCETGKSRFVWYRNADLRIHDFGTEGRTGAVGNVRIGPVIGLFGMSGESGDWTYNAATGDLAFELLEGKVVELDLKEEGKIRFTHTQ